MADELNPEDPSTSPGQEQAPEADAPQAAPEAAEAAPAPEAPKAGSGWGVALSFLFVAMAAAGVISYAAEAPKPWLLGLGLLGWAGMDFYSQRKGKRPEGKLAMALDWFRVAYIGILGLLVLLSARGIIPAIDSSILLVAGAGFVTGYFLLTGALELTTRSHDLLPQALMQASLLLQFCSFLYFAVPGTVSVAAVFSLTAFACLGLASWRGGLAASPALGPGLGLVTILMGLPFFSFFVSEVMLADMQPVVQTTLFMPRYYELKKDISQQAGMLTWAPGNSQPAELGDIHFSDKLAWVDRNKDGKPLLSVYVQGEKQGSFAETAMAEGTHSPWWAPGTQMLAATGSSQPKGAKEPRGTLSLYHWEGEVGKAGDLKKLKGVKTTLEGENVFPHDNHGQIWTPSGEGIYYAAPRSGFRQDKTSIYRATTGSLVRTKITGNPSKFQPAAAPDGSKVLYVSRKEPVPYLEIGDGQSGRNPRRFVLEQEKAHFPAWNLAQTQVLFLDKEGQLMVTSSNNRSDASPFKAAKLRSKVWKSEESDEFFTLENMQTLPEHKLWTMNPDGGGQKMIYDSGTAELISPMWSPDSKRILLIERGGGRDSILTMDREGNWPRKCFITKEKLRGLAWSPDSVRAAWIADMEKGGRQEVWIVERDSMSPERVYLGKGKLDSLSWSPLGEHLAFEERSAWKLLGLRMMRPDMYKALIVDVKEYKARRLTVAGQNARQPSMSPQGDMVAFVADQATFSFMPGIWSLSLSSKRPAALAVAQLF